MVTEMARCSVHSVLYMSIGKPFSTSLTVIINNFDAHYLLEVPQPHVPGNNKNPLVY